jgi:glycosyltransferase involved in cell wall biosynthesis
MKVLFLNYEFPPLGGGASVATEAILRQWVKDPDLEVHLVTAAIGERVELTPLGGKVYVHRLPIGKNPARLQVQSLGDILTYALKALSFSFRLVREAREKGESFAVTLAFFTVPCGAIAWALRAVYGIPYIISLRGADVPGFSEKYDRFSLLMRPVARFLWRRAEAVVPNSEGLRALARRTAPRQAFDIIPNGVDTTIFAPYPNKESGPVIFLSTARLTRRKRIDTLLAAFSVAVRQTAVPLELHIAGDGEERPALEKHVQTLGLAGQVHFLGRIPHEKLTATYQGAAVFVLPSRNEGMSNAALEALASGLPLIVSGTGGMAELVRDGENGILIDPDNTETFARALVRLAEHPEERQAFGRASRQRAEAQSWRQVAERFKGLLVAHIQR